MVTGYVTYGYRLRYTWLQGTLHTVTYGLRDRELRDAVRPDLEGDHLDRAVEGDGDAEHSAVELEEVLYHV